MTEYPASPFGLIYRPNCIAFSQKAKSLLRACGTVPLPKTSTHKGPRAVPAGTAPGTVGFPFRQPWRAAVSLRRRAPPPLACLCDPLPFVIKNGIFGREAILMAYSMHVIFPDDQAPE
jgi:hypothetical protein